MKKIFSLLLVFCLFVVPIEAVAETIDSDITSSDSVSSEDDGSLKDEEIKEPIEEVKISARKFEITYKKVVVYTGERLEPKVTVKYLGKKLREGKSYKLSYKNNKAYGTASIIVSGINKFIGSKTVKFRIAPKKISLSSLKSDFTMRFSAKWKTNNKADGYRIDYSQNGDMSKKKSKTVRGSESDSKTIRGLEAGKKYYVRIRCYKSTKKGRVYSDYSDIKTIRIKNPKYKTSKKNKICLTFDDGPSFVTEKVLDTLKTNNVKATFFIINYSKAQKPIVKRIIDEGHTLAIHNYTHDYSKIYSSVSQFMSYYNKLYKKIKKDFGYEVKVMRFPGGTSNTVSRNYSYGIMSKLTKKIKAKGHEYFDWNIDCTDASGYNISSTAIYNATVDGLSKKSTNIVLMHDSGAKVTTAKALQRIIDFGNNNGYVFEAITKKTAKVQHKPQN